MRFRNTASHIRIREPYSQPTIRESNSTRSQCTLPWRGFACGQLTNELHVGFVNFARNIDSLMHAKFDDAGGQ